MVALAGHSLGLINPTIYQLEAEHARGIVDVTSGSNTVSFIQGGAVHKVTGYDARAGYDLASGAGTIDARYFVPELAALGKLPVIAQFSRHDILFAVQY